MIFESDDIRIVVEKGRVISTELTRAPKLPTNHHGINMNVKDSIISSSSTIASFSRGEVAPRSEIGREEEALAASLGALQERMAILVDRLQPVLRPGPTGVKDSEGAVDQAPESMMGERLMRRRYQADDIRGTVDQLLHNLAL